MTTAENRPEVVALAESCASMDGKLEEFQDERRIVQGHLRPRPALKTAITLGTFSRRRN